NNSRMAASSSTTRMRGTRGSPSVRRQAGPLSAHDEIPDVQRDTLQERHVSSLKSFVAMRGFNHVVEPSSSGPSRKRVRRLASGWIISTVPWAHCPPPRVPHRRPHALPLSAAIVGATTGCCAVYNAGKRHH